MSTPSKWPLPAAGERFLTPAFMRSQLAEHPLTRECYPTAMGYYPVAAGHKMQRSTHDDNLLLYCAVGQGYLDTPGWRGAVMPGQLILLPKGLRHAYQADEGTPWTLYWVHFLGDRAELFLEHIGYDAGKPIVELGLSPALIRAFNSLMDVRRTGYSSHAFINGANQLRHLLTEIALQLNAQRALQHNGFELGRVQKLMQESLYGSLSLDALAQCASMSKYHFSKRYKELTGYSPIRHFLNMKMEHACLLLDTTDLGVGRIALQLGYDDALYFSRLFRRTIGLSPRAYRASIRR